jgi:hypothetical protein
MNEQLQAELSAIIQILRASLVNAKDFTAEQLPEVIRQLLVYHTWLAAFLLVLWLVIGGLAGYVFTVARRHPWLDCYGNSPTRYGFAGCFSVGAMGIAFGLTLAYAIELLQITLAPSVWLIEYAAEFLK